jgi:hypothetical protein
MGDGEGGVGSGMGGAGGPGCGPGTGEGTGGGDGAGGVGGVVIVPTLRVSPCRPARKTRVGRQDHGDVRDTSVDR